MFNSDNLSVNANNHLTVGCYDTVELAKEFGTPLYVLDEDLMRRNCREYKTALKYHYDGNGLILFASKALCICSIIFRLSSAIFSPERKESSSA